MKRRLVVQLCAAVAVLRCIRCSQRLLAQAADEAPDALIKRLSDDVLAGIKVEKSIKESDISRIVALVDSKIMPHVNFQRITADAVGPAWRQATPEQQKRLQEEFRILLVRTYSGALALVADRRISLKPMRSSPKDTEVLVRTQVRGRGRPVRILALPARRNTGRGRRLEDIQLERDGRAG